MRSNIRLVIFLFITLMISKCDQTFKVQLEQIKKQVQFAKPMITDIVKDIDQLNLETISAKYNYLYQKFKGLRDHFIKINDKQYPTFAQYVIKFNKTYQSQQYEKRKLVYKENIGKLKDIKNFTPGVNKFTDWTHQQVKKLSNQKILLFQNKSQSQKIQIRLGNPSQLDWRQKNVVTSIKDQGGCGSCWTFSSAGTMQSYLVKNKKQTIDINLSQQYILQCTGIGDCDGGYVQNGLDKISKQCTIQDQYPYIAPDRYGGDICESPGVTTNAKRKSYYGINDLQLINLLQNGPVSVLVDAKTWIPYASGIISCPSPTKVDHAIIAVGYTQDAYIVKNSWGTGWGQNGFAYVSRIPDENCLITNSVHALYGGYLNILIGGLLVTIFGLMI